VSALTDAATAGAELLDLPADVGTEPAHDPDQPWAVIWPDGGVRSSRSLRAADGYAETWTVHHYGLTEQSARWALDRFTTALAALHRQTVGGRLVQAPEQLTALPLTVDRDADPPLFDLAVEWRLTTSPT
jgi:hypothetical protein